MRWRIPLVVALVAFVAVSCDQQPVEPPTDDAAATPLYSPADGDGNKRVFEWDDYYEGFVDCGGGVYLDLHDNGFAQRTPASGTTDKGRKKWVWHINLTYINPVTGKSFTVHDVGPDKWYVDKDGNVIHTITGRSVTGSGVIGHVVLDDETDEILSVSGKPFNWDDADALACKKLS